MVGPLLRHKNEVVKSLTSKKITAIFLRNQAPRLFFADDEGKLAVRLFFREDGTTVSGLVFSQKPRLDAEALNRF